MILKRIQSWLINVVVPPLVLFSIVVAVWQWCVVAYRLKPYLLPSPLAVGQALYNDA